MKLRISVALTALAFCITPSQAEPPSVPAKIAEETSKQRAIYESRGGEVPEGYVIGRSLLAYGNLLTPEFNRALAVLGPEDRWLDIGAGEGRAILDYVTSKYDAELEGATGTKGKAVAMSIEDRRTAHWHDVAAKLQHAQIDYRFGRPLREYSPQELGRFRLISDVMGGFSYTRDLSLFMENTLALLVADGSFFGVLQDIHAEEGANKPYYEGAAYLTEIVKADGSEMKMCTWLKNISCVEVTCEFSDQFVPPIESYHVRKVCDDVTVPKLELVHFEAGTPPERRFELVSPAPASPRLEQAQAAH